MTRLTHASIPLHVDQLISGTVEKLVFGGSGLLRHEGMVVFVPDVIPGEHICARVTAVKARYATAALMSVETASSQRVTPRCPHSTTCGGCQLQHIHSDAHAEYKRQWLCEAMYGFIDPSLIDVTPAKIAWAWRRTITLHARWESDRWICGFVARDNASLVAVSCCPIFFHDGEERILNELRRCVLLLPGVPSAALDFKLFRLSEGRFALTIQGKLSCNDEIRQRFVHSLSRIAPLDSVCWKTSSDRTYTPFEGSFELWGRRWHFSVDAFLQNHLEQSAIVWGDCLDIVHKAGPQQNILDLYSGIGVTAISLALRGHCVTAVEWSNAAVRMAQRTAQEIAWETASPPRFVCGSVEDFLPSAPCEGAWWIVNPPRTGLSDTVVSQIIKKRPERIVYISCSAPTMARDVKKLVKSDWVVNHVHGYDMFPQTTHFETLVVLQRNTR